MGTAAGMREEDRKKGGAPGSIVDWVPLQQGLRGPLLWLWAGEGAAELGPLGHGFSGSHAGWWDISAAHLVTTKFTQTGQNEDKHNTVSFLFRKMNLVGRISLHFETMPFLLGG